MLCNFKCCATIGSSSDFVTSNVCFSFPNICCHYTFTTLAGGIDIWKYILSCFWFFSHHLALVKLCKRNLASQSFIFTAKNFRTVPCLFDVSPEWLLPLFKYLLCYAMLSLFYILCNSSSVNLFMDLVEHSVGNRISLNNICGEWCEVLSFVAYIFFSEQHL